MFNLKRHKYFKTGNSSTICLEKKLPVYRKISYTLCSNRDEELCPGLHESLVSAVRIDVGKSYYV